VKPAVRPGETGASPEAIAYAEHIQACLGIERPSPTGARWGQLWGEFLGAGQKAPTKKDNTEIEDGCANPSTGQPVVIATGEKWLPQDDFRSFGLNALSFGRTYRSTIRANHAEPPGGLALPHRHQAVNPALSVPSPVLAHRVFLCRKQADSDAPTATERADGPNVFACKRYQAGVKSSV
jgi:hypothetical protein